MSGDVQPRKRKDKKKRKDEGDGYGVHSTNEDVTIHLHKDGGTGGNICAKIVFFFLFSALIVLIGLIIKENQGLSELETIEEESRFSQIFEGWIDKSPNEHEEDQSPELHDDHDEEDDHEEEQDDQFDSEENDIEDTEEDGAEEVEEDDDSAPRSDEAEISEGSDEDNANDEDDSENTKEAEQESDEQIEMPSEEVEEAAEDKEDAEENEESKEKDRSKESDEKYDNGSNEIEADARVKKRESQELPEAKPDGTLEAHVTNDEQDKSGTEERPDQEGAKENSGNINVSVEPESSDSDREDYKHSDIANADDDRIKEDIDAAYQQLDKNAAYANRMFEALLEKYPLSPRLLYGNARAMDILAEERKSNDLLKKALSYYTRALNAPDVPDQLFITIAERYIDRARFMGLHNKAVAIHWQLIERFPENPIYLNTLAVTYLTVNLVEEARSVLKKVLSKWPDDGFALVHYGFILKTSANNLEDAVEYMTKGLNTRAPGVIDGRFYFHLGDALTRLNRNEEASEWYDEGVKQKVFMSKYQRSLYNIERLTAKPWWNPEDIPSYQNLFSALKDNWHQIRQEGLSALNEQGYFEDEAENLKDTGTWKQLELFARGRKFSRNCVKSPVTCSIIQRFPDARGCRRGQTKFSVMHPGTHVWPHCGPTNCRLRIHLGLKVPPKTFIRVAEETRSWKEGDIIIFDDSFEHEVWHNGTDFRLVLIVDVWHQNLTSTEKKSLSPI